MAIDGPSPVQFARNLDLSERRAIEKRMGELEPYVAEYRALQRRLVNVNRRLGLESHAAMVDRSIMTLLTQNSGGMPRHLIIRDLGLPPDTVKSGLERLRRRGQIESPTRGYWCLTTTLTSPL
jgi:hypothetical protein